MDYVKGAEILHDRFKRGGRSYRPLPQPDASALPIYAWCPAETEVGQPDEAAHTAPHTAGGSLAPRQAR